jgi:hypothetical protein
VIIAYFYELIPYPLFEEIGRHFTRELGVTVPSTPYSDLDFHAFFGLCAVRDLYDSITEIARYTTARRAENSSRAWIERVMRAAAEENLGIRIDSKGGVHPLVDKLFEVQRAATIGVLSGSRYQGTLNAFEKAHAALERDPPDPQEAVRSTFDAVENLFKLMTNGKAPRLGAQEAKDHLGSMIARIYTAAPAKHAAAKALASLCDWIDGAHFYRHSPGTPEPAPPPFELAIMFISTGAGFLRWLAEIDRATAETESD